MKYLFTAREKKFIQNTFSRYVSQEVIDEITANPEKLRLGGQKKELTILFSDVRGFTTISEKLSPEDLVGLLNQYLTAMTDTIMSQGGVIDKYIGDAIMAFWGAPIDEIKHAELACLVSLEMIKKLKEKQPEWQRQYGVEVNIGVGLNTGEVVIGNMGSDKRFDYTVMGDSVNLASRLESLTKQYGIKILVSQFTKEKAGGKFVYRFLDKVAVKGKKDAVDIFELVGIRGEVTDEMNIFIENYNRGTGFYFQRDWGKSVEVFSELIKGYPDDLSCKIYLDRSKEFFLNPPASDWDGVCKMLIK
jgi:adenylate cyclase